MFRICHLAGVPKGIQLCITAGEVSVASGTCELESGNHGAVLEEGERSLWTSLHGRFALFEDGFIIRRSIRRFPLVTSGYAELAPFGDADSSINANSDT